jgi:hypothetical protein
MSAGGALHQATARKQLFEVRAEPFYSQVLSLIVSGIEKIQEGNPSATILLSHRFFRLPGWERIFQGVDDLTPVALEAGASALNLLRNREHFDAQDAGRTAPYFTSRPWIPKAESLKPEDRKGLSKSNYEMDADQMVRHPTHLLHRDLAYPVTDTPLFIGRDVSSEVKGIEIADRSDEISTAYCSIRRDGESVVLTVCSEKETFVDGERVEGRMDLSRGQTLHLGSLESGESLKLISCLTADET